MAKFIIERLPQASGGMEVMKSSPRGLANIEAEKGEKILTSDGQSNVKKLFSIGGKKHGEGGTPLSAEQGSIIYSDRLKISDPTVLKFFNESGKKPKTIAEIANKYKLTEYTEKLKDENLDKITKDTLTKNVRDAEFKLSGLYTFQESIKGMPQGHSEHFESFMQKTGITYPDIFGVQGQAEEQQPAEKIHTAAYGREIERSLPRFALAGVNPYQKSGTAAGHQTPTGKFNYFTDRAQHPEEVAAYLARWESVIPGISKSKTEKEAQEKIYDWTLINNLAAIQQMWKEFGNTAKGEKDKSLAALATKGVFSDETLKNTKNLEKLKGSFVDGYFGVRQLEPIVAGVPVVPGIIPEKPKGATVVPDANVEEQYPGWDINKMQTKPPEENPDFLWSAKRNLEAQRQAKRNIPYLRPFTPMADTTYTDRAYYSPDYLVNAINSQVGQNLKQLSNVSAPQQQTSNFLASQQLDAISRGISDYSDKNVAAYNEERGVNTEIANRAAMLRKQDVQQHHDQNTVLKQEYANAVGKANMDIAKAEIDMWDERRNRVNLERSIGEQYRTDPNTGFHRFNVGKDLAPTNANSKTVDDTFGDLKNKYPGVADADLVKLAIGIHSGKYEVSAAEQPQVQS